MGKPIDEAEWDMVRGLLPWTGCCGCSGSPHVVWRLWLTAVVEEDQ